MTISKMHFLITAGPTREFIDPVRFISNPSTGKMGYAVARAAVDRGHDVCLISGPVAIDSVPGVRHINVVSADDMLKAVEGEVVHSDVLVMSAAVADWRPSLTSDVKLKKSVNMSNLSLERTQDILQCVKPLKDQKIYIGFAAETGPVVAEAQRKLKEKGLDLVVANDVTREDSGFESDTNKVTLIDAGGNVLKLDVLSKDDVALKIVEWVEERG